MSRPMRGGKAEETFDKDLWETLVSDRLEAYTKGRSSNPSTMGGVFSR